MFSVFNPLPPKGTFPSPFVYMQIYGKINSVLFTVPVRTYLAPSYIIIVIPTFSTTCIIFLLKRNKKQCCKFGLNPFQKVRR